MQRLVAISALAVAVSTATLSIRAAAPGPQDPQAPVFRTAVSLVRVDVSVTDRDGTPVTGLQAADFDVREDNIPQTVESVQFVQLDGTRSSDIDDSLEIRSREHAEVEAARDDVRLFAIFLDDYHVARNPEVAARAKSVLKELVKQLGPNDLAAIMDPLTPLSALRFTRAKDELTRRIDQFEGRRGVFTPPRSPAESAQLGTPNPTEVRAGVTLSALEALVSYLGGLREGRKSVLLVSEGPPVGFGNTPNDRRLREVLQAANRGNVTIHVYDPQPLAFSGRGGRAILQQLQRETGGRAFFNSNGSPDQISQVIADASAYYLVAYAPARDFSDGRFHSIDVRVRGDGRNVVARNGYWAPTADEMNPSTAKPLEPAVVAALSALAAPVGGRAADVWIGTSRGEGERTRITVTWEPTDATDARRPVRMTVEPLHGTTLESIGDARPLASASTVTPDTVAMTAFEFAPGTAVTLRFEATAADGAVLDRWTQPVPVPAVGEGGAVALSTARIYRAQSAFAARALAAAANPAPSATRQFRQADRVFVDLDVYGADAAAPALSAHLLNAAGEKLTDLPVPAMTGSRARLTLPVASLAPSTYVLHIEATAGDASAHERVAFRVVR
jgi:VWFA-related protein